MDGAGRNHGTVHAGQWERCFGTTAAPLRFFIYPAGPQAGVYPKNTQKEERKRRDGTAMQQTRQRCGDCSSPLVLSVFLKTFLLSAVFLSGSVVFPSSKTKSLDWEDKYGCTLHRRTLTSQRTRVPFSD